MPAFLDDRFHEHDKIEALEEDPREWMAAISVWTVANSYCKGNKTGGRITLRRLRKITPLSEKDLRRAADALCRVVLWHADGRDAWVFHDWEQWSGKHEEDVESKREKARIRQQRRRDKAKCASGASREERVTSRRGGDAGEARDVTTVTQDRSHLSSPNLSSPSDPNHNGSGRDAVTGHGLWEKFDRGRATEYLDALATCWPGLNVPVAKQGDAAQGIFAHFAKLEPTERAAAFERLAKAYRGDSYAPKSVAKFLAESDLTKFASGGATTGRRGSNYMPPAPHDAMEQGDHEL